MWAVVTREYAVCSSVGGDVDQGRQSTNPGTRVWAVVARVLSYCNLSAGPTSAPRPAPGLCCLVTATILCPCTPAPKPPPHMYLMCLHRLYERPIHRASTSLNTGHTCSTGRQSRRHTVCTACLSCWALPVSLSLCLSVRLQDQEAPSGLDLVRCIATARVVMPRTVVRLSAGRLDLSAAEQALAFMAGANSIFDGDKLLTTPNNDRCA